MMDRLMRAMGRGDAGAGRGRVNPATIAEMEAAKRAREAEFEATPEEVRDRKMRDRMDRAYEASRTSMRAGGKVSSASRRADGIAQRGKTKGRMI